MDPVQKVDQVALAYSRVPTLITTYPDPAICFCNPAFTELTGLTTAELAGVPLATLCPNDERLHELIDRVARDFAAEAGQSTVYGLGGPAPIDAIPLVHPVRGPNATVGGLTIQFLAAQRPSPRAVLTDSDRIVVDEAFAAKTRDARQTAHQLLRALQALQDGVAVFDTQGAPVFVNDSARTLLGLPSRDLVAEDFRALEITAAGERVDFRMELFTGVLAGEEAFERELEVQISGAARRISFSAHLALDEVHAPHLVVHVYRDRRLLRERDHRMTLLSHDLQAPLRVASLAASMLTEVRSPDMRSALVRRLTSNLTRMHKTVRDLTDAQRIRAGEGRKLHLSEVDLAAVAMDIADEFDISHHGRVFLSGERGVRGYWNEHDLHRALWNLVTNALQHGAAEAAVVVHVSRTHEAATLTVHSTGSPISAALQRSLADATQAHATTAYALDGWGLGMTLVVGCARAHGGTLRLRSTELLGTTFTLVLPRQANQLS